MTYFEQYIKIKRNFNYEEWDIFARKVLSDTEFKRAYFDYVPKLNIKTPVSFLKKLKENLTCLQEEILRLNNNVFREDLFIYVWNNNCVDILKRYKFRECEDKYFTETHVLHLRKGLVSEEHVVTKENAQFYIDLRKMGLVNFIS